MGDASVAAPQAVTVLVATRLTETQVDRVRAFGDGRSEVLYDPELLPVPRFSGDRHGDPPSIEPGQIKRWRSLLAQAEVMLEFDWLEPAALPTNAPKLRWVQGTEAGIGRFVVTSGLADSGVAFTTAAGVHGGPLAEFVLLGLLWHAKRIPRLQADQREHRWVEQQTGALAGKRALVVGLGHVGREVARRLATMRVEVWGMSGSDAAAAPEGVSRIVAHADLSTAVATVDALVLCCPYTPRTHHLVNRTVIDALSPSAVLVNIARGGVVDEQALIEALASERIGGAVLDVTTEEPLPADSRLWDLPNVLITPHSMSSVPGEDDRILDIFEDNFRRYLSGQPLRNLVHAARGY